MLKRDVDNLAVFFGQYAPALLASNYGQEIWALFEAGELTVDTPLTGHVEADTRPVDMERLMEDLEDARLEDEARLRYAQELRKRGPGDRKNVVKDRRVSGRERQG